MIKRKKQKVKIFIVPLNCPFCKGKIEPHFLEVDMLKKFTSERGKILGKNRTGLCSKHQRRIPIQIKRSRIIGLIPFVSGI